MCFELEREYDEKISFLYSRYDPLLSNYIKAKQYNNEKLSIA